MNYEDLVKDFARRTRKNLEFIRANIGDPSDPQAYEVTQLINSLLGLLVFPQQKYVDSIPRTLLADLEQAGWPRVRGDGDMVPNTLRGLIRYLRNAVAHHNIEFIPDGDGNIEGIRVWNEDRPKHRNWQAELSIEELRQITYRFSDLLLTQVAS